MIPIRLLDVEKADSPVRIFSKDHSSGWVEENSWTGIAEQMENQGKREPELKLSPVACS